MLACVRQHEGVVAVLYIGRVLDAGLGDFQNGSILYHNLPGGGRWRVTVDAVCRRKIGRSVKRDIRFVRVDTGRRSEVDPVCLFQGDGNLQIRESLLGYWARVGAEA